MARLTMERTATVGVAGVAGIRPGLFGALCRWLGAFNIWLWIFVFLPTLITGVYFFGIASDLYMSEADFVVRSQQSSVDLTGLGSLLQSAGFSHGSEDTYPVQDFIMSRDAVRKLEANDHLRDIFDRPGADFVSRFPNPISGSSFEALYKHYSDFVWVGYDDTTGLSTLKVWAYRPEDAQRIAQALLTYSEALVNQLNMRMEDDTLSLARSEVARAEAKLQTIETQLTAYRSQVQMLDPKLTSTGIYATLQKLIDARVLAQTQLTTLQREVPNSPQLPELETRLQALDGQIAEVRGEATGDADSVAHKVGGYEQLQIEQTIAEKELGSANASLEAARVQAERQQLYIERIAEPNLPDYPIDPKRLLSFLEVLGVSLVVYGIAWLLVAGIRDHASA